MHDDKNSTDELILLLYQRLFFNIYIYINNTKYIINRKITLIKNIIVRNIKKKKKKRFKLNDGKSRGNNRDNFDIPEHLKTFCTIEIGFYSYIILLGYFE